MVVGVVAVLGFDLWFRVGLRQRTPNAGENPIRGGARTKSNTNQMIDWNQSIWLHDAEELDDSYPFNSKVRIGHWETTDATRAKNIDVIANNIRRGKFESLILLCVHMMYNAAPIFLALMESPALTSLDIDARTWTTGNVELLAEALRKNTTLLHLTVREGIIPTKEFGDALIVNRTLRSLGFVRCELDLQALIPGAFRLELLDLSSSKLGNNHLLAELLQPPSQLQGLHLWFVYDTGIGDALTKTRSLKTFGAHSCREFDRALQTNLTVNLTSNTRLKVRRQVAALYSGRTGPAGRLFKSDGDTAIGSRIIGFLIDRDYV